jgi:hypothetical protein
MASVDQPRSAPRWAVWAAWAAVIAALPTVIWRALVGIGVDLGTPPLWRVREHIPGTGTLYVLGLSAGELFAALLTLRLIRSGGDVIPRWSPIGPGRRLPVAVVASTALSGAAALVIVCILSIRSWSAVDPFAGQVGSGWSVLCTGCYLAALLWPPALVASVIGYILGRGNRPSAGVDSVAERGLQRAQS